MSDLRSSIHSLSTFEEEEVLLCQHDLYAFSLSFLASLVLGKKLSIFSNEKSEDWLSLNQNSLKLSDDFPLKMNGPKYLDDLSVSQDFLAYFYTSGSSGQAKKVPKTFANLFLEAKGLENLFTELRETKFVISSVSHNHIYGFLFRFLWPMLSGRKVLLEEIVYHEDLLKTSIENDCIFLSSPAFLKRLDNEIKPVKNVSAIFSSGGLLSKEVSDQTLSILHTRPIEVFGSTETGGVAYRQQSNPQSLWIKFPDVEISSTQDSLLKVSSPFIFEKEFVMGDMFQLHANAEFEVLGRADRIAKVEEKRVSLVAIEKCLNSLALVQDSAVIFLEDGVRQQTCAAIVLSLEGQSLKQQMGDYSFKRILRQELSKHFDLVVVPKRFRFVAELPYNSQSKILFNDVRSLFHE